LFFLASFHSTNCFTLICDLSSSSSSSWAGRIGPLEAGVKSELNLTPTTKKKMAFLYGMFI
jgi:hypothetical protein